MFDRSGTRALIDRGATAAADRRRYPRYAVSVPVALHGEDGLLQGQTVNISYYGALVQAPRMPQAEEVLDIAMALPTGRVVARVKVIRVELEHRRFAVDFTHIFQNGHLLLDFLSTADARSKID